jgi:L-seryl-tRNA(Ser) seleniumtransferase
LAGLVREVDAAGRLSVSVEKNASQVGGGSLPAQDLPTWAVSVVMKDLGASALERALRRNEPPVIGRIESDRLLLDVRTLRPEDSGIIRDAFAKILRKDAEH